MDPEDVRTRDARTASPRARRWRGRIFALAVVLVPLVPLAGGSWLPAGMRAMAAGRPANPHGKFQGECSLCHSAEGWKPAVISKQFDHAKYGFPLTRAHTATPCASCHVKLDFTAAAARCASCHADPHLGELGLDCARCHGERSFVDRARMRRAHDFTLFPLSGGHSTIDCVDCHPPVGQGQSQYVGVSADCAGCHRDDYDATTDPAHGPSGFPLDCADCHSPRSWRGPRFDHANTRFPLTGAHVPLPCASCHADGVYKGKDPSCVSCHRSEYDATADPSHAALGFPLACESCHNTTRWDGAQFEHATYFPIYSGAHAGRWAACSTCHTNPVNYATFTCLSCHPHDDRAVTDEKHSQQVGYVYDSPACYSCHPRGTH
jgi:hypothetical protein